MTVRLRYPVSALCSFHYFPDTNDVRDMFHGGLRLIADSGAYSAMTKGQPIDLESFVPWATAVEPYTAWTASLDVIGNERASWDNWRALRGMGLETVPSIHMPDEPKVLDRYADLGVDFVGLGGMVRRKCEPARLVRWALSVFRYARANHPNMRFHGWGITQRPLLINLPWFSVDSSAFGRSYRYGRLIVFDPVMGKRREVLTNGRDVFSVAPLVREHYDIDPSEVSTSHGGNRPAHLRFGARTAQLTEDFLRARHHVTPPTYGLRAPAIGTSVHVADSGVHNLRMLFRPTAKDGASA